MTQNHITVNSTNTAGRRRIACWIEAMRLRTLPVSVSGVLTGTALALADGTFRWQPAAVCLLFAILAQVASNFANEYFDFRDGLDKKGRVGPRRGVTEGDITPRAMLAATLLTLACASLCGCILLLWGAWWLIPVGIAIVLGALAYSTGPYPLSRHGWGEVAVVVFFGLAPVTLTYYLQSGTCSPTVWLTALGTGLLGANVLIVNNYRDREDDEAVGKRTLAVRFGDKAVTRLYLANGILAALFTAPLWKVIGYHCCAPGLLACVIFFNWEELRRRKGTALNPMLGRTALIMLAYAVAELIFAAIHN